MGPSVPTCSRGTGTDGGFLAGLLLAGAALVDELNEVRPGGPVVHDLVVAVAGQDAQLAAAADTDAFVHQRSSWRVLILGATAHSAHA